MKLTKALTTLGAVSAILAAASLTSCNEDKESQLYLSPVNLAVTNFHIKSDLGDQELDTIFFSIDLERRVIFNADSLRKGTDISKLVTTITFSSTVTEAVYVMEGGTTRTGEVDYITNPNDSIDFTGDVTLRIKADNNEIGTSYKIKVNVHNLDPDSLSWAGTAYAKLPSRLPSPVRQKTVQASDKAISLIQESDGTYTSSTCASLEEYIWTKQAVSFPFTPDIDTFCATDEALWMLDTAGNLYTADTAMSSWSATGETWTTLIGPYTDTVIGLKQTGSGIMHAQYPLISINATVIAEDFPVAGMSNFVTLANKWTSSPVAFFTGGRTASGALSNTTWAFDGSEWIRLGAGGVPRLEGASVIPYYNFRPSSSSNAMIEYKVWMLIGGRLEDGTFNRTVYISYDNGVNWAKGADSLQLPDAIPAMVGCDNIVAETQMSDEIYSPWKSLQTKRRISYELDGNVIVWGCPYIYLFGGYSTDGTLYDTVWKGVLSRLTFTPII